MDNPNLTQLRSKHPRFVYEKYTINRVGSDLELQFFFTLEPDLHFVTKLLFHDVPARELNEAVIQNWALHTGLVEALSYWKAACSPEIVVRAGFLSTEQTQFWQSLIHKGMSEFFFVNKIDGWTDDFVTFTIEATASTPIKDTELHQNTFIVPVGGGKDSVVSVELLKSFNQPIVTFTINPSQQVQQLLAADSVIQNIKVTRILDPQLIELNAQGYLNGHTPFSAMVSFVSTLAGFLFNYRSVALSNEFSANEGNTLFLGQMINHQYSKSLEYETLFREYLSKYISETVEYFSFLRPLHELQIAALFTRYPQYFPLFLSCNRGQKTGKWCGECPKCLFVFIMLAAFLPPEELNSIFGQDLFAKESLIPILEELSGVVEVKSLECVGTRQETIFALLLAVQKYEGRELPVLLQYAKEKVLSRLPLSITDAYSFLSGFQETNFVPHVVSDALKEQVRNLK
jgi:hypothetical protein